MTFYGIPCRWTRGAQKEPPTNLWRQLCGILAPTNIRRHRVKFSRPGAMDLCALVVSCSWPTVITYVTETSTTVLETCSTSFFKVCCSMSRLTDAYVFYTFSRELASLLSTYVLHSALWVCPFVSVRYTYIHVWYCALNLTVLSVALYLVQKPKNVDIYPPPPTRSSIWSQDSSVIMTRLWADRWMIWIRFTRRSAFVVSSIGTAWRSAPRLSQPSVQWIPNFYEGKAAGPWISPFVT